MHTTELFWNLRHYCDTEMRDLIPIHGVARRLAEIIDSALIQIAKIHSSSDRDASINLRLTVEDQGTKLPYSSCRIGYFPLTADPIHWEHLAAVLLAIVTLELDCVVLQVNGNIPDYKPYKSDQRYRHTMAQLAVGPFWPLIRYTSLGYDDQRTAGELIFTFTQMNGLHRIFYISGAEDIDWKIENLRKGRETSHLEIPKIHTVFSCRSRDQRRWGLPMFRDVISDIQFIDGPGTGITSSLIRKGDLPLLCPLAVRQYIKRNRLYT